MRTVYVDNDFKCHATNDGTMTAVEDALFEGKCPEFIEGYCYDSSKGYVQIYPWKPYGELERVQREYERKLLVEYEAALAEIEKALGV